MRAVHWQRPVRVGTDLEGQGLSTALAATPSGCAYPCRCPVLPCRCPRRDAVGRGGKAARAPLPMGREGGRGRLRSGQGSGGWALAGTSASASASGGTLSVANGCTPAAAGMAVLMPLP